MGSVADMMLDGTLCAGCGVALNTEGGGGIPDYCSPQCAENHGGQWWLESNGYAEPEKEPEKIPCPICKKKCSGLEAVDQHMKKLHGNEIVIVVHREDYKKNAPFWTAYAFVRGQVHESGSHNIESAITGVAQHVANTVEGGERARVD